MPLLSSKTENKNVKELPLFDHLLELRARILFSLLMIIFFAALSSFFSNEFLEVLKNDGRFSGKLVCFSPYEGFLIYFKISLFSGAVLASPVIFYHIWMFIRPGLYAHEQKIFIPFVLLSSIFFMSGVIFSYFIGIPFILKFLFKFGSGIGLSPKIGADSYLNFILSLGFVSGMIFEWPVLVYFLVRWKIVSVSALAKKRKYAFLTSFIIAGVITPPDIISLFLLGVPVYLLYEAGILLSKFVRDK